MRTWLAVDSSSLYPYLTGYEPTVVNALRGLIKPGAVFIDVGASIGFYSILAAKLGAKVVALEPDFRSFKVLLYNVEMSGVRDRVIPIKAAAGSHVGSLKLKLADYPPWSFTTDFLSGNVTMGIVKVPMISIDEVFRSLRLDKVNVIKIDVEGAGVDVVAGAELVLNWFNPHILFEVHRTVRSDELIAINILKKKFNYDYKILEFRNQNNFICHLMPHR